MLKLYICSTAVHSLARGSVAEMALLKFFSKLQMLLYNIYISLILSVIVLGAWRIEVEGRVDVRISFFVLKHLQCV